MREKDLSKYKNAMILQHYRVTMAKHELSVIEMRVMAIMILKLKDAQIESYTKDLINNSNLPHFNRITIKNADLVVGDNYKQVKIALKSLTQRHIELKKDKGTYFFNLIREVYYSDDKTQIELDVSPHILPELIEIGKNYTSFGLEFLFKTKSTHAIRWYQLGSHWIKNKWFYISKNEIRELFKAENKYKQHVNFQRLLITQPINEVNKTSDITLKIFKTHKEGRSITGYTINVTVKKKDIEEEETELPKNLNNYIQTNWIRISQIALKFNLNIDKIKLKLIERGIPQVITSQRHFDNMTNRFVATILARDGSTNLTTDQIIAQIKT